VDNKPLGDSDTPGGDDLVCDNAGTTSVEDNDA
jgi:hypothetical protein